MTTAIEDIPTLHREEARKFLERAEWVTAYPRGTKMDASYIKKMKDFLREMNLD